MLDKPVINFTRGVPATESFPVQDMITAAHKALDKYGATILQYGQSYGFLPLREWLAAWKKVPVDQVMTGNGSLQIIEFMCFYMIEPGDVVFTESPTYDRTLTMLRRHHESTIRSRARPNRSTAVMAPSYSPRLRSGSPCRRRRAQSSAYRLYTLLRSWLPTERLPGSSRIR